MMGSKRDLAAKKKAEVEIRKVWLGWHHWYHSHWTPPMEPLGSLLTKLSLHVQILPAQEYGEEIFLFES